MRNPCTVAVTLGLLITTWACAADIRKFDVPRLEALGRAIYEQDRRASIATDMMLENYNPEEEGIRGWIVEGEKEHTLIRFVRQGEHGYESVVDATFDDTLIPILKPAQNPALTASQAAQMAARELAVAQIRDPCSERYNSVILPDLEHDGFLVYALAASNDPGEVLVGGDYRFTVSKDGQTLLRADALSDGCLKLPKQLGEVPAGKRLGLSLRSKISDTPLETHVFLSLRHKLPFFVKTRDAHVWKVESGKMEIVK